MRVLVACECSGVVRDAFRRLGHDAWSCDLKPSETGGPHIQGDVRAVLGRGWDMMIAHPECTYLTIAAEWAYKDADFARYPDVGYHMKLKPGTLTGVARSAARVEALDFVRLLLGCPIPLIALENPVGVVSTEVRPPNQTIQPWMFGEDASKGTCLWLKGLDLLRPTKIIPPAGWREVVYAMTLPVCECCEEEAYCPIHEMHFAECDCIGPTQDEATYKRIGGHEFATLQVPAPRPVWGNQTPGGQNRLGPSPTRAADRARTYPGIAEAMAEQWGRPQHGDVPCHALPTFSVPNSTPGGGPSQDWPASRVNDSLQPSGL